MKILSFFPVPYPDECLYSVCCRYYARSGLWSGRAVKRELFGSDISLTSTVYLPKFIRRMGTWTNPASGITRKTLTYENTAYPYLSISYTDEMFRSAEIAIREELPKDAEAKLEQRTIRKCRYVSEGRFLRYCPVCAEEDFQKYGEAYWHRLPQLPGVEYCPKHMCAIQNSDIAFSDVSLRFYPASFSLRTLKWEDKAQKRLFKGKYLKIAEDTERLLDCGHSYGGCVNAFNAYKRTLQEKNYVAPNGQFDRKAELAEDFIKYHGEQFLSEFFESESPTLFWLRYLQESISFNLLPIHHVLIMQFLNGSDRKSGYFRPDPNPYGDGPWPCVNKLCEHYRIDGATKVSAVRRGNDVVAEFRCASCGMLYRRRKPEQSFDEYAKRPIIIEYGELFDSALRECMEKQGLGCEETSKIVGRPYGTVMKRARAIGIDVSIHYTASYYVDGHHANEEQGEYYRRRVLEELAVTPEISPTELSERIPGAYRWFMRHDFQWLQEKLTKETEKSFWDEWGQSTLEKLIRGYERIMQHGNRNRRLTVDQLCKSAGIDREVLRSRKRHCPEIQNFLDTVLETKDNWIVRRYTEIAMQKRAEGKPFTFDDVKRKVQLRENTLKKKAAFIAELIEKLNRSEQ